MPVTSRNLRLLPHAVNTVPLRLPPACDLRREIERAVSTLPERAGFVLVGIGSLTQASLRFAAAESFMVLVEPLEIVSLGGSVTPQGAHLHVSVSSTDGRVRGGHLGYGCLVRTTAEILVMTLPEWELSRERDPVSGYDELAVERRTGRENGLAATRHPLP